MAHWDSQKDLLFCDCCREMEKWENVLHVDCDLEDNDFLLHEFIEKEYGYEDICIFCLDRIRNEIEEKHRIRLVLKGYFVEKN